MPKGSSGWWESLDLTLRWLVVSFLLSALIIFTSGIVSGILTEIPQNLPTANLDSDEDPGYSYVYFCE